jgi:hypothetical protein
MRGIAVGIPILEDADSTGNGERTKTSSTKKQSRQLQLGNLIRRFLFLSLGWIIGDFNKVGKSFK